MTESPASALPLAGRLILVTGASRGIGRASALALAKAGAHVIAVARTQGGLEELDDEIRRETGESATLVPLDLADGEKVDQLGGALYDRFKRLDGLVHAAATLGLLTPVSHMSPRDWDRTVRLNLTASYRLIRSFEPLLKQSDAGRAVFLTSSVATKPRPFWGAYAATKAALETLVRVWADEVDITPIRAAIVDPGRMRTRMRAQAFPGEDPQTLPDPAEIGPLIVDLCRPDKEPPSETVRFASAMAPYEPQDAASA